MMMMMMMIVITMMMIVIMMMMVIVMIVRLYDYIANMMVEAYFPSVKIVEVFVINKHTLILYYVTKQASLMWEST